MEKKILKLEKKANKLFKLFERIINKLIKHNEKLNIIASNAKNERERQNNIVDSAYSLMSENSVQINKLKGFIGKVDE